MIHLVGVSHVSKKSLDRIDEALESTDSEIVCLELDMSRLNALVSDKDNEAEDLTHRMLSSFQDMIGKRTGLMPGTEMLYAYKRAQQESMQVYLVDRDIRETLTRLKNVSRKEKAKALAMLPLGFIAPGIKLDDIPENDEIEQLKTVFSERFPQMYRVLLEERDLHIAKALEIVVEENPEKDVVAVLGAAHLSGVNDKLDEFGCKSKLA